MQRSERGAESDERCRAPTAIQEASECRGNGVAATSLGSSLAAKKRALESGNLAHSGYEVLLLNLPEHRKINIFIFTVFA